MGRSRTLQVVRLPLPLLTLMGWGVWEVWGGRLAASRDGLFFIVPSVMLVFFLAALAHRELQASERIIQD
ncbi:MAG: hypothetical protein GWM98_28340 [Nitrospinaceae bacterium]|nr:hypothetical protein [Nitrospinaceae bacterium]NIR57644.1 hypothetical protein [Nitrospinaceae bacterium]NIS88118.1 hypothetical protein [Nitrospinaceae bacterium]NIT84985.1 hypothetical protein [Nitrospinaceae bacterium]NIU47154.1 hypothetical protein [Nitrospinaceae bacterium]